MNSEAEQFFVNHVGPRQGRLWVQALAAATPVVIDLVNVGGLGWDAFGKGGFIELICDQPLGYKLQTTASGVGADLATTGGGANVLYLQPANTPKRFRVDPQPSSSPRAAYRYLVLFSVLAGTCRITDAS